MSKLDKDEVIANFTAAYEAANGKAPQIEAKGGWYSVDGGKNLRLAALDEMTAQLAGGQAPAAAEKPVAKPAKKAKAKAKLAANASSTDGPVIVSVGSGLKPKDFWQNQQG